MPIALLMAALALASSQDATPAPPPVKPDDTTVGAVTLTGTRAEAESQIDRRSYAVANDLQAQTGSIADALRDIPSVQVDLQGNISLRGDANVTVLVDGKPSSQFSGQTLAQALQSTPANQIDRIEVITNPSAEFRADGKAGVINLVMKTARGAGKTASVRIQGATGDRAMAAGNAGYNSNKLSTTADFSLREDHQIPVVDSRQALPSSTTVGLLDNNRDLNRGDITQQIATAHLGSDYDLTDKTRLSAGVRGFYGYADWPSLDRFVQDGDNGQPVSGFSRSTHQHASQYSGDVSTVLRHTWSEGRDLLLTGRYNLLRDQRDRFDLQTPDLAAGPVQTNAFNRRVRTGTSTVMADYETPLPGKARLKVGYDFEYTRTRVDHDAASGGLDGKAMADPIQTGVFLDNATHNQAYATYEQPFGKLDVQVGLRGELMQLALDQRGQSSADQTYGRLYPSLHSSYELDGGKKLTVSYARRVDRPSYDQLDPIPYNREPGFELVGNPALRPQSTDSFELGFEDHKDASSFEATLYYRQIHSAFSYLYANQAEGVLHQQAVNAGGQRNGGVELILANTLTPTVSYNLSADAYWSELSAANLGLSQPAHLVTGFGRANLTWRVTPKDLLQFNIFMNGATLLPQGRFSPLISGNIGYRHTINSQASWMLVIQDPFNTAKGRAILNSSGGRYSQLVSNNTRMASLTLVWTFGGKPQAADFDFKAGGTGS